MPVDQRDQLWEAVFKTYYNSYFEEMLSDALLLRWQRVDDLTKLAVAITASGSAITGVTLFTQINVGELDLTWVWTAATLASAFLALFHKELAVPFRLRDHADSKRSFLSLRIDLETFRDLMSIDPRFPIDAFTERFQEFRKRFSDASQRLRVDSLVTLKVQKRCQAELNERLGDAIIQPKRSD